MNEIKINDRMLNYFDAYVWNWWRVLLFLDEDILRCWLRLIKEGLRKKVRPYVVILDLFSFLTKIETCKLKKDLSCLTYMD